MATNIAEKYTPQKERFYFLDGLRGIAAICVCLYHFSSSQTNGWLAVDFFFLLSGFVIAHSYEEKLLSNLSKLDFLKIRLARLYPLYFITISLGLFISAFGYTDYKTNSTASYIFHIFILPTPSYFQQNAENPLFPMNLPAWSIYLEIVINLLYASVVMHLTNMRLLIASILFLVTLIYTSIYYGSLNIGIYSENWLGGWARILWGFSSGLLIYRFYSALYLKRYSLSYLIGLLIAGYFLWICFLSSPELDIKLQLFNAIIIFPTIIIAGSIIKVKGIIKNTCDILGQVSYPIYLIQFFSFYLTIFIGDLLSIGNINNYRMLVTLILAFIILFAYDIPVRNYLMKKIKA